MNTINKKILKSKKAMNAEIYKSKEFSEQEALSFLDEEDQDLEYEKLKKGLYRNRDNFIECRIRSYVKDENKIRKIFGDTGIIPKNKIYDAKGKKKEYQHSYPAKSQWKWKREEEEKLGKVKPEIQEIQENDKKVGIPKARKKFILYDGKYIGIYEGIINGFEPDIFTTKVWKDGRKINSNLTLKRWKGEEDPDKKVIYMGRKLTVKDLIKAGIHLGIPIYEVIKMEI